MEIKDIPISVLDSITRQDIEEYLSYISLYEKKVWNTAIQTGEKPESFPA